MHSESFVSHARRFTTFGLGAILLTSGACDDLPSIPEGTGSSTTASAPSTATSLPDPTNSTTTPSVDSSESGVATPPATDSGSTAAASSTGIDPTTSGSTGATSGSTGASTSGSTGASTSGSSTSMGVDPTATTGTTGTSEGFIVEPDFGGGFIVEPDGGGMVFECDQWEQDCPAGDKCMPWSNDGGGSWNATRCSPIDAAPVGTGEVCQVEGSGTSGIDNCELGSMCWDVDNETNSGTCVEMCTGSPEAPVCDPPGTSCVITNDGVITLCLLGCDPLVQDCGAGEGCYAVGGAFNCAPDASGAGGADGDACAFLNACDPGQLCTTPDAVDGCFDIACCTPFCDTTANDCPAAPIEECLPFFEPGAAPPGLENAGVCGIPA